MFIYTNLRNKWRRKTVATRTAIKLTILAEVIMSFFLYLGYAEIWKEFSEPAQAQTIEIQKPIEYEKLPSEVKDTINYFAKLYGVEPSLAIAITTCESKNDFTRIGYEAKVPLNSVSLWQFQPQTFYEYAAKYKMRNANLYDWRDQTILAMQMLRDGKCYLWSCCPK